MTTTPPTNAQMDAMFQSQVADAIVGGGLLGPTVFPWTDENGMAPFYESGGSPITKTAVYVGWTDSTGAQYLEMVPDPRDYYDGGYSLYGSQSVVASTPYLQGLISQYGAINLRKYTVTFQTPSDIVPAGSTEQTALNTQANWIAAP